MQRLILKLYTSIAWLLVALLLAPSMAMAEPQPLDPGTVHIRILKRGLGRFIALRERNGVDLFGRILGIGDEGFTLQLHNDPQTTEIAYSDVAYLRTGFTNGQKVAMIAGIGAVAGFSIWGFVHVHNLEHKPLPPPMPVLP